jgi:hypothetical protein
MNRQEQTLWDRISQVADNMRDIPEWKRGSSMNERSDSSSTERDQRSPVRLSTSSGYHRTEG